MTQESKHNRGPSTQGAEAICIRQRSGIWNVSVNGKFYGDYTRRHWAIEAAVEKADDLAARGGAAVVTIDGQQNAILYDTRRPASAPGEKDWLEEIAETFLRRFRPTQKQGSEPSGRTRDEPVPPRPSQERAGYWPLPMSGTVATSV